MSPGLSRSSFRLFAVCLLSLLAGEGCSLMLPDVEHVTSAEDLLSPIVESRDMIDLEVYFVDRRIGDPLIGESLWSSLSAVTAVSPESRNRLNADGFRFAMAPSRPPRTLQSLLRLSDETDPARRVIPHRYSIPSGQETLLMVSSVADGTSLVLNTSEGTRTTELNHAQCLLRVSAERVDESWARLTVTPEIRHGVNALRPIATDQSWQFHEGQRTLPFYQHRLSAEVNSGEVIVLGIDPAAPEGLASYFFRSELNEGIERLILLRVGEMRRVDPVRVESH